MSRIVISRPCGRPAGRGESVSFRATVLVLGAWLITGGAPGLAGAQVLQWKFKPGEILRYSMDQKVAMVARGMDRENKSTRSQIVEMTWKVNSVAGDGSAEVAQ